MPKDPYRRPKTQNPHTMKVPNSCIAAVGSAAFLGLTAAGATAAIFVLPATDAGFVTEAGGSAKGDSTLAPPAKYNYSVGFEEHYATGALGPILAPMFRKNYFVFDLTGVTKEITSAKLTLWSGTLETADFGELYEIHESTDPLGAAGLATALTTGTGTADFDSPSDPLVIAAGTLYTKLADGPLVLGTIGLIPAFDDSFVEIAFTPGGIGYLNLFLGETLILGGVSPSAMPPVFPQQPFGFTGPDIPGGDPKTPMLTLTTIPEPSPLLLVPAAVGAILLAAGRRRGAL